jgi:hypothetical protein
MMAAVCCCTSRPQLSPRLPSSPRSPPRGCACVAPLAPALPVVHLGGLPCDLIAAVFAALPLDAAARLRAVARAWRAALSGAPRWARLDCSAAATARWAVRASAAAVLGALDGAAAIIVTSGGDTAGGATSLDLTGQPHLDGAFLLALCAREARRAGGGALAELTAPDAVLAPAVAAAICDLLPHSLRALTVSAEALGGESGASLGAALGAAALRVRAFALAPAAARGAPPPALAPAELAAALAPQARWLTRLDLSAARLRDAHMAALAPVLAAAVATSLRALDISENELSSAAAQPLAAAALPRAGGALTHLDISGNALGAEGLAVLQAALLAQQEEKDDDDDDRCAPLRRLVMQCVAPPPAARAFAAAVEARGGTEVALDWGAHAWRLWGAA